MVRRQAAVRKADPKPKTGENLNEIGTTGLNVAGGRPDEEFLRMLRGEKAFRVYREMSENDEVVSAMLYAIEMLLRQVKWTAEPYDDSAEAGQRAEYLESLLDDMSHTWPDFISEWMATAVYGFCPFEVVLKLRQGESSDPTRRSRFDDGLWGIRKLAVRHPMTLNRWVFGEDGGVEAMEQLAPPLYRPITIPIRKLLLFRARSRKGNPEGTSLLRGSFVSWYRKKRLMEIEAIGVERNLAGIPLIYTPPQWHLDSATSADKALLAMVKKIGENLRNNDQACIILPSIFNAEGEHRLLEFSLVSGASRQLDLTKVIERYDRRIAMTLLADVIMLGHEAVGSFALASSKTNLFSAGLGALLDGIRDVLNRYLRPQLAALNGWRAAEMPTWEHGDVESVDLAELGDYVTKLANAGAPLFPDPDLEAHLRRAANLPPPPKEPVEPVEPDLPVGGDPAAAVPPQLRAVG